MVKKFIKNSPIKFRINCLKYFKRYLECEKNSHNFIKIGTIFERNQ